MRYLLHLATRFFRSLRSSRPGPDDQLFVSEQLEPTEAEVFWRQPVPDQDHALRGARFIARTAPSRIDLVRAFLLHDVGKRHARLGTLRRSIVTGLSLLRLPVGRRGRAYLDHAAIGAAELETLTHDALVLEFARGHHGPCPPDVSTDDWTLLVAADLR